MLYNRSGSGRRALGLEAVRTGMQGELLPKVWRACVGAGAAQEGLRADWQRQLGQVVQQCGFEGARMTGMSQLGRQGWQALDTVNDYLAELEVLPVWRVDSTEGIGELESLVRHSIARYGAGWVRRWRFELPGDERYGVRRQALKELDSRLSVGATLPLSKLKRFAQEEDADFVTVCGAPDVGHLHQARRALAGAEKAWALHWDAVRAAYGMDDALHLAIRVTQLHLACTMLTASLTVTSFSGICNDGAFMMDAYGVQQPGGHAYRMLSALGDEEISRGAGWILTRDVRGRQRALAWSEPCAPACLWLTGLRPHARVMTEKLDAAHGWAYPVWRQMGCPEVLSRYQAQALRYAALHTEVVWHQADAQGCLSWQLPGAPDAMVLLVES